MFGTYRTDEAVEARVTAIDAGNGRHYLVVRFRIREWKTLIFQRTTSPDSWLSRRELHENMEPVPALTGILLGPQQLPHPIELLKREVALLKKQNWDLHNRLMRASAAGAKKSARKRVGRGRGNT